MDKDERQKIYTLLSKYYPNARQLKDKHTLLAWGYALQRFPYEAVKNAVIDYATGNKYFPDLADITAPLAHSIRVDRPSPGTARDAQLCALWRREMDRLRPLRRAAGLPVSPEEARAAGMSAARWWQQLEARGLNPILDQEEVSL